MKSVKVGRVAYRIVCASYGDECHRDHCHHMKDRAAAVEAAARHNGLRRRPGCGPWVIQAQAISEWGDPDAAEMCLYAVGRTLEGRLLWVSR